MEPIVTTRQGRVCGLLANGIAMFKGIPYAAPPYGPNRFAAPAPVPRWAGVRECVDYGPTAPKPPTPAELERYFVEPTIPGDDCLNLNIWTPDPAAALPVLVWIHGGSFVYGTGAVSLYDGSAFARDGVVCVTINYRLGVDGFLLLDGVPANRGLLDQIAALRWVHENIAAFGGDPDNVTIAGESVGAMCVCQLMVMPQAKDLFRRAIAQSGAAQNVLGRDTAERVTSLVAERLGVAGTVEGFAAVPIEDLLAVVGALTYEFLTRPDPVHWPEVARDLMLFEPCVDGEVIAIRPLDALRAGTSVGVDLLIGTNDDEFAVFFVPFGVPAMMTEDMLRAFLGAHGLDVDAAIAAYRDARPGATAGQLWLDAFRDSYYRVPAMRVAEALTACGSPTFVFTSSAGNHHNSAPAISSTSGSCSTTSPIRATTVSPGEWRRRRWPIRCTGRGCRSCAAATRGGRRTGRVGPRSDSVRRGWSTTRDPRCERCGTLGSRPGESPTRFFEGSVRVHCPISSRHCPPTRRPCESWRAVEDLLASRPEPPILLALGEPTHGIAAFPSLRNELLRHLVERGNDRSCWRPTSSPRPLSTTTWAGPQQMSTRCSRLGSATVSVPYRVTANS